MGSLSDINSNTVYTVEMVHQLSQVSLGYTRWNPSFQNKLYGRSVSAKTVTDCKAGHISTRVSDMWISLIVTS